MILSTKFNLYGVLQQGKSKNKAIAAFLLHLLKLFVRPKRMKFYVFQVQFYNLISSLRYLQPFHNFILQLFLEFVSVDGLRKKMEKQVRVKIQTHIFNS